MPDTQRRTPQQARARATVDAILVAAAQILEAQAPERFTAKRVAERAGVSIGTLYQYFANKGAILEALAERYGSEVETSLAHAIEQHRRLPLRDAVRRGIEHVVALHRASPKLHHTLACDPEPIDAEALAGFRRTTQAYLQQQADAVRDVDPELASMVVTRAALALVHTTSVEEPEWLEHPDFAREVSELLIRYLAR